MTLLSLSESIPTAEPGHSPEERMRAMLGPLVARASSVEGSEVLPVQHRFSECPNCGKTAPSERSPFCGDGCREMAAFVRQFRASLQNGLLAEPDRQLALAQKLWSLQGGGYPYRQTLIPPKTLRRVIDEAGGRCSICGAPATGAEHAGSGWNRPINLRAVCSQCNRAREFGNLDYLQTDAVRDLYEELANRIGAREPVRLCDNPDSWDWREYLRQRKLLRATSQGRGESP